jgi:hypothetical protein
MKIDLWLDGARHGVYARAFVRLGAIRLAAADFVSWRLIWS